ncbi:hypothetical protein BDN72DRAFT_905292 [Pluteus cervinus]|uniref:Uncharacterized protein n=1 Tax=Pluteus cervinus TaxID=181527 RepID=A0ACD3A2I7_9AGAR|nr:hypothetical protein BDN72DRAFT_905292 [Pluteus cervinus]
MLTLRHTLYTAFGRYIPTAAQSPPLPPLNPPHDHEACRHSLIFVIVTVNPGLQLAIFVPSSAVFPNAYGPIVNLVLQIQCQDFVQHLPLNLNLPLQRFWTSSRAGSHEHDGLYCGHRQRRTTLPPHTSVVRRCLSRHHSILHVAITSLYPTSAVAVPPSIPLSPASSVFSVPPPQSSFSRSASTSSSCLKACRQRCCLGLARVADSMRRAHRTSETNGGCYSADSDSDGGGARPRCSTHHHHTYQDENRAEGDDLVFGYVEHDKEEDKTVTTRSRRVALSRIVSPSNANMVNNTPPPPVPPLPYIPHSGQPTGPYPRSPPPVFSVPPPQSSCSTSASTYSSSQGPHATSTTQLRPTLSHTSFLSNPPPSLPIHKERERRLRKKSRPPPQQLALAQNTYEMGNISRIGYDLPEENEGQELVMRPTSPGTPVTPSPKLPPETASSMHSTPASHTSNLPSMTSPPPSTGKSALLTEVESRFAEQQDMDLTPRPQSSWSSIPNSSSIHNTPSHSHSSHGRDSRAGAHSPTPPPLNPSWFFRATSGSSSLAQRNGSMSDISMSGSVPAHERSGGKSRERERTEKMLDRERERDLMYTPSPEGSLSSRRGGGPETPNKLSKRKSLGFAQLRGGL